MALSGCIGEEKTNTRNTATITRGSELVWTRVMHVSPVLTRFLSRLGFSDKTYTEQSSPFPQYYASRPASVKDSSKTQRSGLNQLFLAIWIQAQTTDSISKASSIRQVRQKLERRVGVNLARTHVERPHLKVSLLVIRHVKK